ncbi:hypothetical protein NEOKW01_0854 [Nematocida sp. AWRm80]|nr:hypothetical protein NEOKW01_0854 [Nematocida sp. AWRm80]
MTTELVKDLATTTSTPNYLYLLVIIAAILLIVMLLLEIGLLITSYFGKEEVIPITEPKPKQKMGDENIVVEGEQVATQNEKPPVRTDSESTLSSASSPSDLETNRENIMNNDARLSRTNSTQSIISKDARVVLNTMKEYREDVDFKPIIDDALNIASTYIDIITPKKNDLNIANINNQLTLDAINQELENLPNLIKVYESETPENIDVTNENCIEKVEEGIIILIPAIKALIADNKLDQDEINRLTTLTNKKQRYLINLLDSLEATHTRLFEERTSEDLAEQAEISALQSILDPHKKAMEGLISIKDVSEIEDFISTNNDNLSITDTSKLTDQSYLELIDEWNTDIATIKAILKTPDAEFLSKEETSD